MRKLQSKGMNESVQSLTVIMPPLFNQVCADLDLDEEDKYPTQISKCDLSENKSLIPQGFLSINQSRDYSEE